MFLLLNFRTHVTGLDIDLASKIWLLTFAKNDRGLRREYAHYWRVSAEWATSYLAAVPGVQRLLVAVGLRRDTYGKVREI